MCRAFKCKLGNTSKDWYSEIKKKPRRKRSLPNIKQYSWEDLKLRLPVFLSQPLCACEYKGTSTYTPRFNQVCLQLFFSEFMLHHLAKQHRLITNLMITAICLTLMLL